VDNIIEYLDWRLIFNVKYTIGIIAIILGILLLKDTENSKDKDFDYVGFFSSAIGIICNFIRFR
jgi:uncharacterized membrane protein YkgB